MNPAIKVAVIALFLLGFYFDDIRTAFHVDQSRILTPPSVGRFPPHPTEPPTTTTTTTTHTPPETDIQKLLEELKEICRKAKALNREINEFFEYDRMIKQEDEEGRGVRIRVYRELLPERT